MSGTVGSLGGAGSAASTKDVEFQILCDVGVTTTRFLRKYTTDSAGATTSADFFLDGATPYAPTGTVGDCIDGCETAVILCDSVGQFIRKYKCDGTVVNLALDGVTIYAPTGTVKLCEKLDLEAVDFCLKAHAAGAGYAVGDQLKLTRWFNPATNTQVSEVAFNMTAGGVLVATPLTAADFDECPAGGGASETLVCASGTTLIRRVDAITGVVTFIGSNGAAVAAPAAYTIGGCFSEVEFEVLCDNANVQFLRRYVRNLDGTISTVDTTLDGVTAFAPANPVKLCQTNDLEAVDFCLRANTAGAGYAVGDQIKLTRWFNTATNTQVSEVAFNMTAGGAAVTVPLTAANFDECPAGGGASETLVCAAGTTLIRRVDAITGAITFIGSNGAAVAAPATYTIGGCFSEVEFEVLCDNNGSFLRRYTRNLDGTISITNTTLDGTTAYAPVGTVKICTSETLTVEVYRLAGTAAGVSTNGNAGVPVVGNSLVINGPYKGLSWQFLRQSAQDDGTGNIAKLDVNGFQYSPGSGPQYQTTGINLMSGPGQVFNTTYTFLASGQAFAEVTVIR